MTDKQKLNHLYGDFGNVSCIRMELKSSSENAVAIGFYLAEIKRCEYWTASKFYKEYKSKDIEVKCKTYKYYKASQYTFYDYCHDEFNFSRRTVDRYMNIFIAFARVSRCGTRTKFIDDKYKDYNCSQLSEMLGLSDKKRQAVNPDMTVKEIRALKKDKCEKDKLENKKGAKEVEADAKGTGDKVVTFVNKNVPDSIAPDDVNVVFDKDYEDKTFKKKKYHVCGLLFDKFVSTPSQYTQQFVKLQEYLNKGYLARIVLYAPEEDSSEGGKASNE